MKTNIDLMTAGIFGTCLMVVVMFFYGLYQFVLQVAGMVAKVL